MRQVFRHDSDGYYVEPVILKENEPISEDCTDIIPADGLFKAKFVDGQWIEELTDEEIQAIKNTPQPISPFEQLAKDQADLTFTLMLNGVI